MKLLCQQTPFPIALDEELIGVFGIENKRILLEEIQPQYIILKPTICSPFFSKREITSPTSPRCIAEGLIRTKVFCMG